MFVFVAAAYPLGSLPACFSHCRMDPGSPQRDSRCYQSEFLGDKRRWSLGGYERPQSSNAESLVLSYQSRIRDATQRDIHHRSLVTYRNGWRKYLGFCAIFDVAPLSPGVPWPDMFECFLLYAVQDALRKIAPGIANEYVSHTSQAPGARRALEHPSNGPIPTVHCRPARPSARLCCASHVPHRGPHTVHYPVHPVITALHR
jgi:hypothetical protein